jgi:hypothetical protein
MSSLPGPPLKTLILIDGSAISVGSGFYRSVLKVLPLVIPENFGRFAIGAFTSHLSILKPNRSMLCYPTLDDCLLAPSAFYQSPPEDLSPLFDFQSDERIDLLATLKFAENVIGSDGRIIVFLSSMPITFRPSNGDLTVCTPTTPNFNADWKQLQSRLLKSRIWVDFLVNLPGVNSIDTTALSLFVDPLCGNISVIDSCLFFRLKLILRDFLETRPASFTLLFPKNFRIRGASMTKFFGKYTGRLNSRESLSFDLEMKDYGPIEVPFQLIVSYRKMSGECMTRVFSRMIPCSDDLLLVYRRCSTLVILKSLVNRSIARFEKPERDVAVLYKDILSVIAPFFKRFRTFELNRSVRCPSSLSGLPLLCLGCLKSTVFGLGVFGHERCYFLHEMKRMNLFDLEVACSPLFWDITDYLMGQEKAPKRVRLKASVLCDTSIFLLDDGFTNWIWIGDNIDKQLCHDLLGCDEPQLFDNLEWRISDASRLLYVLVKRPVRVCLQNKMGHWAFVARLIEDRSSKLPSIDRMMDELEKTMMSEYV